MTVGGIHPATGESVIIHTRNGRISEVVAADRPVDRYVSPGWVDLQVNGFAGVDYNHPRVAHDEIARTIEVQQSTGVARFCPTVITGSSEDMLGCLRNLARARRSLSNGSAMLGFHVEGPWISPHDGPRGAHPRAHVRAPSIEEFRAMQDAAEGLIRLVTLSPEHDEAPAVIEHMAEAGVVVSLGHTAASRAQIADAVKAGATVSTHLGNGAHATMPRHGNYIVHQLAEDSLYAGLIVDGIHLPPDFVKVAVRAKHASRCILVTDAVAPAHCPPGVYKLGEQPVELLPDRRVELLRTRRLAGSALSMDRGIENVMKMAEISLSEATRMATANVGEAMGMAERRGFLEVGQAADFTVFHITPAGSLQVDRTIPADG